MGFTSRYAYLTASKLCGKLIDTYFTKGIMDILGPFDELTTDLSSQFYPSLSKVIPSVKLIERHLAHVRTSVEQPCLIQLVDDLLREMKDRFGTVEGNTSSASATFLDPRYDSLVT